MLLTMIFEIPDKTAKWVSNCAIERVVNQTIEILEASDHGYAPVNLSDWKDSKSTVVDLWIRLQDAIFRQANGIKDQRLELVELRNPNSKISKSENPILETENFDFQKLILAENKALRERLAEMKALSDRMSDVIHKLTAIRRELLTPVNTLEVLLTSLATDYSKPEGMARIDHLLPKAVK